MGIFSSSSGHTCPAPKNAAEMTTIGVPIVGSVTFQHLILYICSACLGIVGITCLLNISMHLSHYSSPAQQRQIIRIVLTPVVFCLFSVCAVANYSTAIYVTPIRDLYETFAMAAIFLLFVEWVSPDPSSRDAYFSNLENHNSSGGRFSKDKTSNVIPGGSLAWFKSKWTIMFLSIVIDIIITIAQEASQAAGTYCATSLKPYFAHLWVLIIGHAAIIVGVLAVLHLYLRLKPQPEFATHRPLLKLLSLKLIVFTNFVQTLIFSVLQGQGVLTGSTKITANDLQYGIPALLVAVEQLIFAALMLYSFRSAEYKHGGGGKAMGFLPAAFHAMNPLDLIQSIVKAFTYLLSGAGRPNSKQNRKSNGASAATFRKTSQGNYSPGEDTVLQPYQYPNNEQQSQSHFNAPTQPLASHSYTTPQEQEQEQYVGVIPNYGGHAGEYPVSGVTENRHHHHGDDDTAEFGRRGGRRYHGPIGMLISAGMSAAQSAREKK